MREDCDDFHGNATSCRSLRGIRLQFACSPDIVCNDLFEALSRQLSLSGFRRVAVYEERWRRRNPVLSFLFVGLFLFRFEQRKLSGLLLFQEPPRRECRLRRCPTESGVFENRRPQSVCVRMSGVTDPRHRPRTYLFLTH